MESNQVKDEFHNINPEDHPTSSVETPVPPYKHKWTSEQRVTLSLLGENYSNTWRDITSVFNRYHDSDLRECGGLRTAVVSTQFWDMRKYFNAEAAMRELQATLSIYDRAKLASRADLEHIAHEIGVQLIPLATTNTSNRLRLFDNHDAARRKRNRSDTSDDKRTDYLPERTDEVIRTADDLWTVYRPTHLLKTPTKNNGKQPLTPPDSRRPKKQRVTAEKKLAKIGFRASTVESQGTYSSSLGIRAGAFVNCPNIPLARELSIIRYREEALHHITKTDHSRPSMFISATINPMRALHILLHALEGEKGLILIDLNTADENGNVEKARDLNLKTEFNYTAAGEYLIFGGVGPKAIISYISLASILSNTSTTLDHEDPFRFKILQAHRRLSYARRAITKDVLPMTYALGKAVGSMVGTLSIPPKHFQNAIWAFVQDYKFYKAEGGKRGHWQDNIAFKDGAVQGYQAVRNDQLGNLEIENRINTAREIIEIHDDDGSENASGSDIDSVSSNGDVPVPVPVGVEDWIRKTQASQPVLQYYDVDTSKWTSQQEDLNDEFIAQLENTVGNLGSNSLKIDGIHLKESMTLDSLCADVMNMHRDEYIRPVQAKPRMEVDYEFSWTGM